MPYVMLHFHTFRLQFCPLLHILFLLRPKLANFRPSTKYLTALGLLLSFPMTQLNLFAKLHIVKLGGNKEILT